MKHEGFTEAYLDPDPLHCVPSDMVGERWYFSQVCPWNYKHLLLSYMVPASNRCREVKPNQTKPK